MLYFACAKAAEAKFSCKCCLMRLLKYPKNSRLQKHRRFVQALDAEHGYLIEGCATMMESIVWRTTVPAERLEANTATLLTTHSPHGFTESAANDVSGAGFSRQ